MVLCDRMPDGISCEAGLLGGGWKKRGAGGCGWGVEGVGVECKLSVGGVWVCGEERLFDRWQAMRRKVK